MEERPKEEQSDAQGAALNPYCIYFYHLTKPRHPSPSNHPDVRAYVIQRPATAEPFKAAEMQNLLVDLVRQSRDGQITPVGWGIGDIRWRRQSYLAVALDHPDYAFPSKGSLEIKPPRGATPTPSFTDATLLAQQIDGSHMVHIIYCLNHLIKLSGTWFTESPEESVRANPDERFHPSPDIYEVTMNTVPPVQRLHEDSAENLGPPIGPP